MISNFMNIALILTFETCVVAPKDGLLEQRASSSMIRKLLQPSNKIYLLVAAAATLTFPPIQRSPFGS